MDAITLLENDHRTVEKLFAQYEKLGDGQTTQKKAIVHKLIHELSIHASIEEELLYPTARKAVKQKEDLVLESLEEHHLVKVTLSELQSMSPSNERYDAKVTVLKEAIEHHVEEEESDLFPALRKKLDKKTLENLGAALASAKRLAPTRPHPNAPDTPPGNVIAGLPAALLDRVRDLISGSAGTARSGRKVPASRGKKTMNASAAMNRMGRAGARAARKVARKAGKGGRSAKTR